MDQEKSYIVHEQKNIESAFILAGFAFSGFKFCIVEKY
jgi:hypothetical protein